ISSSGRLGLLPPHAPRACPGRGLNLRKSGKPDLRWGRGGEGGRSYGASCVRQRLPPPPTPPQPAAGLPASGNLDLTNSGEPELARGGGHTEFAAADLYRAALLWRAQAV